MRGKSKWLLDRKNKDEATLRVFLYHIKSLVRMEQVLRWGEMVVKLFTGKKTFT